MLLSNTNMKRTFSTEAPELQPKNKHKTEAQPKYRRSCFLASTPAEIMQRLTEYGVAVVPNAMKDDDADGNNNNTKLKAIQAQIMQSLEDTFPGFKRDQPETWRTLRDNGAKHAMLLQTHGLGWSQGPVDVRQAPEIAQLFADIWTERAKLLPSQRVYTPSDMLSSADGLSVYLNTPDSRGGFQRVGHSWLHWDRSPEDRTPSIQGFLNFMPTPEHGAALEVLLRSNQYQQEFAARFPDTKAKRFHILESPDQLAFYTTEMGCDHVCIAAEPGDLVLWDSRLIHCGRAATRQASLLKRMVVYVSMQPKHWATPRDLELKRRAYKQLRSTSHNASTGVELFPVFPRVRCAADDERKRASRPVAMPPLLTPLGRSLFGLLPQ